MPVYLWLSPRNTESINCSEYLISLQRARKVAGSASPRFAKLCLHAGISHGPKQLHHVTSGNDLDRPAQSNS